MKKSSLFLICLGGVSLFANSSVKSIDLYTNKSFINQKIDTSKKSINLLGNVKLKDIKFILDDSCKINSFDVELEKFSNDKLTKEIEVLNKNINLKQNKIKALKSNTAYLEKSSINGIDSLNVLQKTSKYIKDEILDNYNEIYKLNNEIKSDNDSLKKLIEKRSNNTYTKLDYDIKCKSQVLVNYPITNLQKRGFYDISYNSKKNRLQLKNLLFLKQSLGEDLENIEVNLYTYNYINQIKPYGFVPEYLDLYEKKISKVYAKSMNSLSPAIVENKMLADATRYSYEEGTTKSFFKAKNVDLKSGKDTKIVFANDTYKSDDKLEIDGYSMSQAFYKVDFKSDKLYGVLNANLYLDGSYVGQTRLNEIKKDKKSSIYFGTNRFIDIKKEIVKDMKETPFFSMDRVKSEKIWNYKITNKSSITQKIVLLDRVPVSRNDEIKVKLIGETKETKLEKNGKISFEFTLKPNTTKTINFGYEIDKPTN